MMSPVSIVMIRHEELGLKFCRGRLLAILKPGWHVGFGILGERIDVVSEKCRLLVHPECEQIARSGLLAEYAEMVSLTDEERALLWIDGRFEGILVPGVHLVMKRLHAIKIERVTVDDPLFEHRQAFTMTRAHGSTDALSSMHVEQGMSCLYFRDGRFVRELGPGFYTYWKDVAAVRWYQVDLREKQLDLSGQEIITADKVSLRLNAVLTYRVANARTWVQVAESPDQSLYRDGQLALRAAVGGRTLDGILAEKDALAAGVAETLKPEAERLGLSIVSFGIRDIILPGDMRELMNRVVAAQKEAEANQIVRREETAATRSQCNTARMLEQNPVLMKLRELEVLERIAEKSKMSLILGEKGLTERLVNML